MSSDPSLSQPTDRHELLSLLRLLQLVRALDMAGACPISLSALHSFVYFSNVLSPLWDISPYNSEVLKNPHGPFYPAIQRQIDKLIAWNSLVVERYSYIHLDGTRSWLDASISLSEGRMEFVDKLIDYFPDEQELFPFLEELALAFSEIDPDRQDDAALADATYSDAGISEDRLIRIETSTSYGNSDASVRVAEAFQTFATPEIILSRAEKLLMYMRLIKRRANG